MEFRGIQCGTQRVSGRFRQFSIDFQSDLNGFDLRAVVWSFRGISASLRMEDGSVNFMRVSAKDLFQGVSFMGCQSRSEIVSGGLKIFFRSFQTVFSGFSKGFYRVSEQFQQVSRGFQQVSKRWMAQWGLIWF